MPRLVKAANGPLTIQEVLAGHDHMTSDDSGVSVYFLTVTPAIAAVFLKRNTRNRNIVMGNVDKLANEMKHGIYLMNGDTIGFDTDMVLTDGQHRLQAIIRANKPQDVIVVTGLSTRAFLTKDQGSIRSLTQIMKIEGITTPGAESAVRFIVNYQMSLKVGKCVKRTNESSQRLLEYWYKNEGLDESLVWCRRNLDKQFRGTGVVAMHYIITRNHPELGAEFFDQLRKLQSNDDFDDIHSSVAVLDSVRNHWEAGNPDKNYELAHFVARCFTAFKNNKNMGARRISRVTANSFVIPNVGSIEEV
jgi:hypothetical protein